MKRLAYLLTTAVLAAVIPAHSASATVLTPCDWHGYSLSPDTSGELTAASDHAYPLECRFYQYKPGGRTYIGSRVAYGSPVVIAEQVGFAAAYSTELCTYADGLFEGCRLIW